jgi:hypothetical protein
MNILKRYYYLQVVEEFIIYHLLFNRNSLNLNLSIYHYFLLFIVNQLIFDQSIELKFQGSIWFPNLGHSVTYIYFSFHLQSISCF